MEKKATIYDKLELHQKKFFQKETIELIDWIVSQYYTSYKNVVKLFVTGELADLFKKEVSVKKKSHYIPLDALSD